MTDLPVTTGDGPWLVAPDHPDLAGQGADRINDPDRPDRLAWNAFRTLAEWNSDVWVPSLLEGALGPDNPLSGLQWGEAEVAMWRTASDRHDVADVVVRGPDAVVLVSCTLRADPDLDELSGGVQRALDLQRTEGAGAAFVLVVP